MNTDVIAPVEYEHRKKLGVTLPEDVAYHTMVATKAVRVNGTKLTLSYWHEMYAQRKVGSKEHKFPHLCDQCKPDWMVLATCTHCDKPLIECVHNVFNRYDPHTLKLYGSKIDTEGLESVSKSDKEPRAPKIPGQRGKQRTTLVSIADELLLDASKRYSAGEKMVELAKEYNVQPQYFSTQFKAMGIVVKRGQGLALAKAREAKKKDKPPVKYLTDAELKTAKLLYNRGSSCTSLAKKYDVLPATVSEQLKKSGITIKKGKR